MDAKCEPARKCWQESRFSYEIVNQLTTSAQTIFADDVCWNSSLMCSTTLWHKKPSWEASWEASDLLSAPGLQQLHRKCFSRERYFNSMHKENQNNSYGLDFRFDDLCLYRTFQAVQRADLRANQSLMICLQQRHHRQQKFNSLWIYLQLIKTKHKTQKRAEISQKVSFHLSRVDSNDCFPFNTLRLIFFLLSWIFVKNRSQLFLWESLSRCALNEALSFERKHLKV